MTRRLTAALVLALCLAPAARAQIASVSYRSAETLLEDLGHFAPLLGFEEVVKPAKEFLNKNLQGVDRSKPLGLYVLWPEKIGKLAEQEIPIVLFVPLSSSERFLESLPKLDVKLTKGAGDTHQLTWKDGTEGTVRLVNNHAYLTTEAKWLKGKLPEPATFLPAEAAKSRLIVNLRVDQFPKDVGKLIDSAFVPAREFAKLFADDGKKKPGETEEQYRARLASATQIKRLPDLYKDGILWLIENTRAITLHLDADPKEGNFTFRTALQPKPSGNLKEWCAYAGSGRSSFYPLVRKADAGALIHFPPSLELGKKVPVFNPEELDAFRHFINVPGVGREAVGKLLEVFFGTFAVEGLNLAVMSTASGKEEIATVVGLKVHAGRKLESALRDLHKNLPAEQKKMLPVAWNHDRHGNVRVHQLRVPDLEMELYLAVREDALLMAFDKPSVKQLKTTLDNLSTKDPPAAPLIFAKVGSKTVLMNEDFRNIADKELSGLERNSLSAEMSVIGGTELSLRVQVSASLVRLLWRYFGDE